MKFFFLLIVVILTVPDNLWASVSGECANCHVMHASKQAVTSTPRATLLNNTCLGCHTGTNDGTNSTPFVYTTGTEELAGGNFRYAVNNERYGHNPIELGAADSLLTGNPPGWKAGFNANGQVGGGSPNWSANNLSCAGTYGCHGRHNSDGIFGSHHNHPTTGAMTTADTVGNSYRFLYGIKGYEDSDYEYQASSANGQHNVYFGTARSGAEASADTPVNTHTMSYLCAECHGIFHSGSGNEGISNTSDTFFSDPWIRHPVDISMPTTGEYASYTSYNLSAPLASDDVSDNTVDMSLPGDRIVMCLSCHRAHASPYYAGLRWNYRGTSGTWVNGCAICHSDKS
ncbi:MAG TPA: hypothetical protein ENK33_01435 [Desulfobacterales bacterium]|nr:hypothetical protein [Desulfobacterales bacterium]